MHRFGQPYIFSYLLLTGLLLLSQHVFAATKLTTKWLSQHLRDANLVLIDMDYDLRYRRFHLTGAVHLPLRQSITQINTVSASVLGANN
jgi:3-mercaptopyruvate sulfurtransferase SseA